MSLATSKKPAQLSIRSFFQAKTPVYAPPPPSLNNDDKINSPPPPPSAPALPPSQACAVSPPQKDASSNDSPLPSPPAASSPSSSPPPPPPPPPPNLPREASIRPITASDITPLRRLNSLLLPVSYPDTFYNRAADPSTGGRFSRVVTWAHDGQDNNNNNPKIVGAIVCRVEPDLDTKSAGGQVPQNLYIQSLCLLSPYRSMGLIAAALDTVVAAAASDPALDVRTVTAHVWTDNEDGLRWYQARGFTRHDPPIKGYYVKLRPDSAWLVSRPVGASVRSALPASSSAPPSLQPAITSTTAAVLNLPPLADTPTTTTAAAAATTTTTRPPPSRGQSYQNQRAETEWNDLPPDMAPPLLAPPRKNGSEPGSSASSRSSSTARKKKDRSYPAAAFGS